MPDDLAVVFQDYSRSLFPWLTVRGNVEFPLRCRGVRRAPSGGRGRRRRWSGSASPDVGGKYPWQLSGGMQQRVAIARALACRPALLLMDEPFASVDAQTRVELEDLLLRVQREHGSTVLLVTHDIDESVYLGDRVLVLSQSPATIVADLTGRPACPSATRSPPRESAEFVDAARRGRPAAARRRADEGAAARPRRRRVGPGRGAAADARRRARRGRGSCRAY